MKTIALVIVTLTLVACNVLGRRSLHQLFERDVCAEASDGQDTIVKALDLKPAVIVLALSMPLMNGLTAARILRKALPNLA